MKKLSYKEYFDRVYGCFLGKCIGGTAGGPAEGRKELLDFPLNEDLLHQTLPNDDLDLQILWLELIEDRGIHITAKDMAHEFHDKIPYGPGEYGYAKKNIGRGIYPPTSGRYNNRYYKNGMGCPIRSEIWGCLFPGAPELTKHYTDMDGSIDHEHDSIEAEYFLASLEADAFFTHDLRALLDRALARLNPDDRITRALSDTIRWYDAGYEWKQTRSLILRNYGHSDCTNLYQNMSFTLLALLYGGGDFRETVRLGLACGYDTDCICATAASILGILRGAEKMLGEDGLTDTGLSIAILTRRRNCSIKALTVDVCAAGMTMADAYEGATDITDRPEYTPLSTVDNRPIIELSVEYDGDPVVSPERDAKLELCIKNRSDELKAVNLEITAPEGITSSVSSVDLVLQPFEAVKLPLVARVAENASVLHQKNIFGISVRCGDEIVYDDFGIVGADIWYRYGPFIMNNIDLSHVPPHEYYGGHITYGEGENVDDVIRDFHLNNFADIDFEYIPETIPFTAISGNGRVECMPERISVTEDLFDIAALQSFAGPHTDYLVRRFVSTEDTPVRLVVGNTAPFKLWLNGELIGSDNSTDWWTCENRHFDVNFRAGENIMILKCAQLSDSAKYSVIPQITRGIQFEDFPSVIESVQN